MNGYENNVGALRGVVLLRLGFHGWGCRAQADRSQVQADANKDELTITKRLLRSPELKAVYSEYTRLEDWIRHNAMASPIRISTYLVKRKVNLIGEVDNITRFEHRIANCQSKVQEDLLPAFFRVYPEQKKEAQLHPIYELKEENGKVVRGKVIGGGLGGLYNEADYPSEEEIRASFRIDYQWFAISVPNELPEEVYAAEAQKLRAQCEEERNVVRYALRESLSGLVNHMVDRLGGDGPPKQFVASSMARNWEQFFDSFPKLDIADDQDLQAMVVKAKNIVATFVDDPAKLRVNTLQRAEVVAKFAEVKGMLDTMLQDKPIRKFSF